MSETRTYDGYLLVDWRDDDLRFRKTKPTKSERKPTEYPVEVSVEVEVPEYDVPTLAAELSVPEAQVKRAAHDDLLDAGAVPEWHGALDDALDHFGDEARRTSPQNVEFDDLVSKVVGYVMRKAEGYPDAEAVETEAREALRDAAEGEVNA